MNTLDFGWITGAIDQLTQSDSALFLAEGHSILTSLAVITLIIYALTWALQAASYWHGTFNLPGLVQFFVVFSIADGLLKYYSSPLPFTGSSIHSLLPDVAHTYANWIQQGQIDTLFTQINGILNGLEKPSVADMLMIPIYILVELDMWIVEGILFAVTAVGFVALGIGALLGPVFIPWLVVPRLSWLFWNWFQFMLEYSFFRVVAGALVYVWSGALVLFFSKAVHQDLPGGGYSLGQFFVLIPAMVALNIAMAWSILRIHAYTSDLFKGTSSAGSNFVSGVTSAVRGAFA